MAAVPTGTPTGLRREDWAILPLVLDVVERVRDKGAPADVARAVRAGALRPLRLCAPPRLTLA
jgi:hypothetical protein